MSDIFDSLKTYSEWNDQPHTRFDADDIAQTERFELWEGDFGYGIKLTLVGGEDFKIITVAKDQDITKPLPANMADFEIFWRGHGSERTQRICW